MWVAAVRMDREYLCGYGRQFRQPCGHRAIDGHLGGQRSTVGSDSMRNRAFREKSTHLLRLIFATTGNCDAKQWRRPESMDGKLSACVGGSVLGQTRYEGAVKMKDLSGGCRCGAIRYSCFCEPLAVSYCYCRDCQ